MLMFENNNARNLNKSHEMVWWNFSFYFTTAHNIKLQDYFILNWDPSVVPFFMETKRHAQKGGFLMEWVLKQFFKAKRKKSPF
jgi:hypothetical protein